MQRANVKIAKSVTRRALKFHCGPFCVGEYFVSQMLDVTEDVRYKEARGLPVTHIWSVKNRVSYKSKSHGNYYHSSLQIVAQV